jgi:hypothetical protein
VTMSRDDAAAGSGTRAHAIRPAHGARSGSAGATAQDFDLGGGFHYSGSYRLWCSSTQRRVKRVARGSLHNNKT